MEFVVKLRKKRSIPENRPWIPNESEQHETIGGKRHEFGYFKDDPEAAASREGQRLTEQVT